MISKLPETELKSFADSMVGLEFTSRGKDFAEAFASNKDRRVGNVIFMNLHGEWKISEF